MAKYGFYFIKECSSAMTNISALEALRAAVAASDTITQQPAQDESSRGVDFSSYLKTDKNLANKRKKK